MMDVTSKLWDDVSSASSQAPSVVRMSSTWLTKRRAVDHCRVRSSLCRMS
jgi:hypothetical protein